MARTDILTPVGRLVRGSLYKGSDKDAKGLPRVVKTGPNAGQPRLEFFFAVAIKKGAEAHWNQTPWGAPIWQCGQAGFPQGQANGPLFSWKITDGDSRIPNKKGKLPCDGEGYPGHWVLNFSNGFAPKIFNANGSEELVTPDLVKLGYYIQVAGSVGPNTGESPGIYLNPSMVAFSAQGPVIEVGPDASEVGFGQSPLPAGASPVPATPMQVALGPVMTAKANGASYAQMIAAGWTDAVLVANGMMLPVAPVAAPVVPVAAPVVPVAAPVVPVVPNPAFLAVPPPVPVALGPVMTAKANGASYAQMIAAGWTDAVLVANGMMLP